MNRFYVRSLGILVGAVSLSAATLPAVEDAATARRPRPVPLTSTNAPVSLSASLAAVRAKLPPPPDGVADLAFTEFFQMPVGPRGLEFTDRLRSLDGKKVRLLGFMVRQANPSPWKILFSPYPVLTNEKEFGPADDLPPHTVHVFLPRNAQPLTPHTREVLLLTGTLSVGNREEADGRISTIRLTLDAPPPGPSADRSKFAPETISTNPTAAAKAAP